ncbi:MAG TPA: hypothetical protein VM536_03335 [Chloroflexia bacterium]|nr:hypothetical protein [Chloroflexia bacterium]
MNRAHNASAPAHGRRPAGWGGLLVLLLLLAACDSDVPTVTPLPPPPSVVPSPVPPSATAARQAPSAAPAPPTTTGVLGTATPAPLALATADVAVLTPVPTAPGTGGRDTHSTAGLLYLSNGSLAFYDVDHQEVRLLYDVGTDAAAPQRVVAFTVAPTGDRLAYLLTQQGTVAGACRQSSQLWLLDMNAINNRRLLAENLLPPTCDNSAPARVVTGGMAFAPDGTRLAYLAARAAEGPVDLWLATSEPAREPAPRRIAAPEAGLLLDPRWSPDGTALAFLQAGDLGTNGSYDADLVLLPLPAPGAQPGTPVLLASGHGLPGGAFALPPFDVTWLDAHTLGFQAWDPARGPAGAWAVDTAASPPLPRLLTLNQAGLGAWSPAAAGPRRFAYRQASVGLALAGQADSGGVLLATEPGAGPTGSIAPTWSAGGEVLAFSTAGGALLIADRGHPGAPVTVPISRTLRAAWNAVPGDPPLLATLAADSPTLGIYDRAGRLLAQTQLPRTASSPQEIIWAPVTASQGIRRLAVRYAGGKDGNTPFVLATFDQAQRTVAGVTGPPAADGPLVWAELGPLPEP